MTRDMSAGLDRGRLELYLPSAETAIGQARAAVDRLEALDEHPEARFAVRLLVSELFTNAVKYGERREAARVRFVVEVGDSRVRVEVGDRGTGSSPTTSRCRGQRVNRAAGSRSSTRSRPAGA